MITLNASARYGHAGKQYVARVVGRHPKFTFDREFIGKKSGKRGEDTTAHVDDPGLYEVRNIDSKGRADVTFTLIVESAPGTLQECHCDREDAMKVARSLGEGRSFATIVEWLPGRPASPLAGAVAARANHQERWAAGGGKPQDEVIVIGEQAVGRFAAGQAVTRADLRAERQRLIAELDAEIERRRAAGEAETPATAGAWAFTTPKEAEKREVAKTLDAAIESCWHVLQALPEPLAKKAVAALRVRVSPPKSAPEVGLAPEAPVGMVSDKLQDLGADPGALGLLPTPVAAD